MVNESVFENGVEYQLNGWSYNNDYTKIYADYISNEGHQITKTINV